MSLTDHAAPGSNAGFGFQFERALYWLAQSPAGSIIGIETEDDVDVRGADGSRLLEQDKHSILEDAKPFGDRSKDLWNTLAIWIEALDSKEVAAGTTHFLMVTNKALTDCIASRIGQATTASKVEGCIAALEAASKEPPKHIATLTDRVLRAESRENLRKLILHCEMADGSHATSGAALRSDTIARLPLPAWCAPHADSIVNELSGWLHDTALSSWRLNEAAWIPRDNFINQLHAIIDRRKRNIIRERSAHLIPVTDAKIGENKGSRFVKQLYLVTDDDSIVENAIRDLVRCNIEKSRLSAEGNITDEDWKAFEAALHTRWEKIRLRIARTKQGAIEEDIGFEIFTDTTEEHREKLAGSDTEQVYLTSGTYHRLADLIRVGWHPRFEELMSEFMK